MNLIGEKQVRQTRSLPRCFPVFLPAASVLTPDYIWYTIYPNRRHLAIGDLDGRIMVLTCVRGWR